MTCTLLNAVAPFLFFWLVFGVTKSSSTRRDTNFFDYVENLTEKLGILQDENVRLVFDQDFLRRNSNAADKSRLTTVLNTSTIVNSFRVHVAFAKFDKGAKITDLKMNEENGVRLSWNAQYLPVKNTSTTNLYDISWLMDEWKVQGKKPGKLNFAFNISNTGRQQSRKRVLKNWSAMIKGREWLQIGPLFLIAYFKDTVNGKQLSRPNPSTKDVLAHRLRSGTPSTCKLHSFRTSFQQLGLSFVYVSPRRPFNLGVCYGPCDVTESVDSRVNFMTTHAWMLELARVRLDLSNSTSHASHLQSTCVATAYQGQRVFKKEPNGNLVYEVIPDFTASECGCR